MVLSCQHNKETPFPPGLHPMSVTVTHAFSTCRTCRGSSSKGARVGELELTRQGRHVPKKQLLLLPPSGYEHINISRLIRVLDQDNRLSFPWRHGNAPR